MPLNLVVFAAKITASQIAILLGLIRPGSVSGPEKFVFCQNGWQAQKKIVNLFSKHGC